MEKVLGYVASKANFSWFPFHSATSLLIIIAILVYTFIRNLHLLIGRKSPNGLRQQQKSLSSLLATASLACLLVLIVVNGLRVKKNIDLAMEISNNLSLTKEILIVPDYLSKNRQQFMVIDGKKEIAIVDTSGYHAKNQQGEALYRLSKKVYRVRRKLLDADAVQQAADNRTIKRSRDGQSYVAYVSPGDNQTYKYVSRFSSDTKTAKK